MKYVSVLNDVLGPVMHGPSSSHTAGSYRIGRTVRSLIGETPQNVSFFFHPNGSYIKTYREQGADLAFATGLLGWEITDTRFNNSLNLLEKQKIEVEFVEKKFSDAFHPNSVKIEIKTRSGKPLQFIAESTGGGSFHISKINNWKVDIYGKHHELLIESNRDVNQDVKDILQQNNLYPTSLIKQSQKKIHLIHISLLEPPTESCLNQLIQFKNIQKLWYSPPVFYMIKGKPLFDSAVTMVEYSQKNKLTLGEAVLAYESSLLGLSKDQVIEEILYRWEIMLSSLREGLSQKNIQMQLLEPMARKILKAENQHKVAFGGLHTRAAARAMAVMHTNNSKGIVCAAPTGGSSGTLPGVVATLFDERDMTEKRIALALLAAGGIGLIVASRATFAAEVAGCQVEIGAAGAMAAAAVVESVRGTAQQSVDAAAISFQNTMGLVCDLVQGLCEIPCHTRNAVAASSAFVCADLILGGYMNPIPLDETIDAVMAVGKMMPSELRVTSLGGLAVTPSALALKRKHHTK
jgi:L-serine dehydratase